MDADARLHGAHVLESSLYSSAIAVQELKLRYGRRTCRIYDTTHGLETSHAVVIIPGFAEDVLEEPITAHAATLFRMGYRVILLQPAGIRSGEDIARYSFEEVHRQIAHTVLFAKQSGSRHVSLLGFTIGGMMAVHSLSHRPFDVRSVVTVNAPASAALSFPQNVLTEWKKAGYYEAHRTGRGGRPRTIRVPWSFVTNALAYPFPWTGQQPCIPGVFIAGAGHPESMVEHMDHLSEVFGASGRATVYELPGIDHDYRERVTDFRAVDAYIAKAFALDGDR